MNEQNRNPELHAYDVRVGLSRVRVEARTHDEAIQIAREAFCREMPRMWDVISSLASQRFIVEPALR